MNFLEVCVSLTNFSDHMLSTRNFGGSPKLITRTVLIQWYFLADSHYLVVWKVPSPSNKTFFSKNLRVIFNIACFQLDTLIPRMRFYGIRRSTPQNTRLFRFVIVLTALCAFALSWWKRIVCVPNVIVYPWLQYPIDPIIPCNIDQWFFFLSLSSQY